MATFLWVDYVFIELQEFFIMDISLLSVMYFTNIFSYTVAFPSVFLVASFKEQKFYFDEVQFIIFLFYDFFT